MISQVIWIFSNLHINKHARFDEIGQSLLGYTDIAIYIVFDWSYYMALAWHLKVGNHTNILQMDRFVICKRGLNLAHWYTIYSQAYPMQGLKLTPVC